MTTQPDLQIIFEKERSDLSTRAANILTELGVFDFDNFMDFMRKHRFSFNFLNAKNCGSHTAREINDLVNIVFKNYHLEKSASQSLEPIKSNNERQQTESKKVNIAFLYKPMLNGFKMEDVETTTQLRIIDEFNYLFSNLSVRSRNIISFLEIETFKAMLTFLQTAEVGFRFSRVQNCGKKAEAECDGFLRDVIKIILKNSDKQNNPQKDFSNSFFQILDAYIFDSKKFDKREIEILKVRFKINKNSTQSLKSSLKEIADKFDLTRERIRQLEILIPKKLTWMTNHVIKEFNIDLAKYTSPKFFLIDEDYLKIINEKEQTDFSLSFILLVWSSIFKFNYEIHEFSDSGRLFAFAIDRKIRFDFDRCFKYLTEILENPIRKKDEIFQLDELNEEFSLILNVPMNEDVRNILLYFLKQWDFVQIDGDRINIPRNTKFRMYEYIEAILKKNAKPLHFTKIYNLLIEDGVTVSSPLNVHSVLQRFSDIFGLKGQGIYGLKEWGGHFGSIGDVAEEYLNKVKEPVSMRELEEFICKELIVSQESIREVLLHYEAENRFVKHRNGKIGLSKWENVQLKMFK